MSADTPRYLKGQCPDNVHVGQPFSVLASIVREAAGAAPLKLFPVGRQGQDILLVLHAPGLQVLSGQRQVLHVPFGTDSEPVMFELQANKPGPCQLSISAWHDGTFLGDLTVETTASRHRSWKGGHRDFMAGIETAAVEGAVSLVVRYDSVQNSYRFEFRDEDNPAEVTCHLAYQPGQLIERLIAGVDRWRRAGPGTRLQRRGTTSGKEGTACGANYSRSSCASSSGSVRTGFGQLTILADNDAVPWELLYPLDPGHDNGFLVEQFPVTRVVFGRRPSRSLSLSPAWFVLPDGSPVQAREEVAALSGLLTGPASETTTSSPAVIGQLTPLLDLIRSGQVRPPALCLPQRLRRGQWLGDLAQ